ncbi:hypothetical protein EDD29_5191 [Actinocorallia herbida]|uniref:Uncharacterized protein n=1 Tax=Actinocorallia herbida TaxID=58109 RepID=A0A3N1D3F3_9ACTN|nr:hypothetical protein EDD29_5191 [Actinocorallia herbida]
MHRALGHERVVAGIAAALGGGALFADVVAVEARKAVQTDPQADPHRTVVAVRVAELPDDLVSFTRREPGSLPAGTRLLPLVSAYDQLLRRTSPAQAGEFR